MICYAYVYKLHVVARALLLLHDVRMQVYMYTLRVGALADTHGTRMICDKTIRQGSVPG